MSLAPDVSVAICTHNRSALLGRTLEGMTKLRVPEAAVWELLVVDNASEDDTARVVGEYEGRLPVRLVFESRLGKSFAANRAVEEARSELIVWTDDDVVVDPEWLAAYHRAATRRPETGIFGGPIDPWFDGTPPSWLKRAYPEVANAYAAVDLGPHPVSLTVDRYPYGANMALRRSLHLSVPFDTRIGPRPRSRMRGEEMVVLKTLLAEGVPGVWVPEARVRHLIPKDRQTVGYLRGYFVGAGQVLDLFEDPPGRRFMGRPLWVWREAIESELKYRLHRPFGDPARWVVHLRSASVAWGRLLGHPVGDEAESHAVTRSAPARQQDVDDEG